MQRGNVWTPGTPIEANYHDWTEDPIFRPGDQSLLSDSPTVVDLFCGGGGFSEGFSSAGFRALVGLDIHPPSIDTFQRNHPEADVIVGDIKKVHDKLLLEAIDGRPVDVVTAGVPCQGFSLLSRKRWDQDERNFLFREFIRVVRLLKPKVVILENVSGLKSAASGEFKRAISEAIGESGYHVEVKTLNALDYGVPQKRNRVFFLGTTPGTDSWWPAPTHGSNRPHPHLTVWDAIGDLPEIGPSESTSEYDKEPFTEYQRIMRGESTTLNNHKTPRHPPEVIEKIGSTKPGEPIYPRFKQRIRLHKDMPSPTQVAGGIRPQYQFGHPKIPRGLTVRERCRLQSLPDHYYICGGIVQGRVQTGNAVPPLLAHAIAEQVARMLKGEPRPEKALPPSPAQMGLLA